MGLVSFLGEKKKAQSILYVSLRESRRHGRLKGYREERKGEKMKRRRQRKERREVILSLS